MLAQRFCREPAFTDLEFSFDSGGMVRGALNEGKSSPLTMRITGKQLQWPTRWPKAIKQSRARFPAWWTPRIIQRMNYPQFMINVDRAKAAELGLTQADVMRNVVAACNSSISFNKHNFWIDPVTHNQYFVGVQYPEKDIQSIDTLLDIPITGPTRRRPFRCDRWPRSRRTTVPSEVTHYQYQPTIDLTMNVEGRDLGPRCRRRRQADRRFGKTQAGRTWAPYDPRTERRKTLAGRRSRSPANTLACRTRSTTWASAWCWPRC